jgi:hypothetical protein
MKQILTSLNCINQMKKLFSITLLLSLLFIISCSGSPQQDELMHGTKGIDLNVQYIKPGQSFVHGEFLDLYLEVMNKGMYDDPKGFITITGHNTNAISFKETKKEIPTLLGKKTYLPEGDSFIIKFDEIQPLNVPYGSSHTSNLLISSCYEYKTMAIVSVCVPSRDDFRSGTSICKQSVHSMSSQGAPVAVTYIEPSMGAEELQYVVHVSNVGDGVVIKQDNLDNCPSQISPNDVDEIEIEMQVSALGVVTCTNDNKIRLLDGKGATICKVKKNKESGSYMTQMEIILSYGYSSSITEKIKIVDPFYTGKDEY